MLKIARLNTNDRKDLFTATAQKMNISDAIVEKDFWVCFMLDHLFHDCEYKDAFVFKGGTSLSKSYHVIERFSEDIDLTLDTTHFTQENKRNANKAIIAVCDTKDRGDDFCVQPVAYQYGEEIDSLLSSISGAVSNLDIDKVKLWGNELIDKISRL